MKTRTINLYMAMLIVMVLGALGTWLIVRTAVTPAPADPFDYSKLNVPTPGNRTNANSASAQASGT